MKPTIYGRRELFGWGGVGFRGFGFGSQVGFARAAGGSRIFICAVINQACLEGWDWLGLLVCDIVCS